MRCHPHAPKKAHERGGEIPSSSTANQTGVIINRQHSRQAMLAEKLGNHLQESFRIEVGPDLPMQPDRGTSIDKVSNLNHMLPFPLWISRHTTGIFEVELDFLPRPS